MARRWFSESCSQRDETVVKLVFNFDQHVGTWGSRLSPITARPLASIGEVNARSRSRLPLAERPMKDFLFASAVLAIAVGLAAVVLVVFS
jgi:hypothetical protein